MYFFNENKEKLRFSSDKKRITIASLFTSLITLLFLWLIGASFDHVNPRFIDYMLGILLALYFGILTLYHWSYLLKSKNKFALEINKQGIWDNTFFSYSGAIAWEEIEEILFYDLQLKSGGRERVLGIIPKTGKEFVQKFPFSWHVRRLAIAALFRFPKTRTPINILLRDLQLSNSQEFEREIQERIQKQIN